MADLRTGTLGGLERLSPLLLIFRLRPEEGTRFPDYAPGQYIALRRNDCRLTRRVESGRGVRYVADADESGNPRLGPVTHSYSIASAPCETAAPDGGGCLEFYVVLERDERGTAGRLSSSLFRLSPPDDGTVMYVNRIAGTFTLAKRAGGHASVLLVGSGTGLAPFVSMIKQLDYDACHGAVPDVQYTLLHANRTYEELAYHRDLLAIEEAGRFDFLYVASVSRPTARDFEDPRLGRGRANNLLRHIFDMPLKEEEDLQQALARGEEGAAARAALERTTPPALPRHVSKHELRKRVDPARTVVLTCGNPSVMADIEFIAHSSGMRFEKEEW